MDVQTITNMIGSLGFPTVMCIMLIVIFNSFMSSLFSYMKEQNEQHQEETSALKDAINELKLAITTLTERLNK